MRDWIILWGMFICAFVVVAIFAQCGGLPNRAPDCPPRIDYEPRGFVPVTQARAVRERGMR
jgi:hypothetical protein